jgi:DNA-binding CsgD family transcriptional regulator
VSSWIRERPRPGPVPVFRRFADRKDERVLGLSLTQQVIVRRLVKGQEISTIADALGMSKAAVYGQMASIRKTTGTHSKDEVIGWAREHPEILEES